MNEPLASIAHHRKCVKYKIEYFFYSFRSSKLAIASVVFATLLRSARGLIVYLSNLVGYTIILVRICTGVCLANRCEDTDARMPRSHTANE